MWLRGAKKRLGGTVIYQAMGQTRQRELASEVTNPRTQSQMGQRVKWSNLVNLYRANRSWMKYAYETKKASQSEYNKFMSLNVSNSRIYLTKAVANAGGCVVDEYVMTQGSLPSIEFVLTNNGFFASNIGISDETISQNTTIASFSRDVLEYNPGIREGDQLSFVRMTQMTNASTGVPYVVVREYEVIIDSTNNASLWDYLPQEYFVAWGGGPYYLAIGTTTGKVGGFCMILSRTIGGKTYVSSQRVVLVGMSAFIQSWSSQSALQNAIDSYGVSDDAFLSSTYASPDFQAATQLAMLDVYADSEERRYVSGSRMVLSLVSAGNEFSFTFNGPVTGTISSARLITNRGDISLESLTATGSIITGEVGQSFSSVTNAVVMQAIVVVDSLTFTMDFQVNNEDTIHGLE